MDRSPQRGIALLFVTLLLAVSGAACSTLSLLSTPQSGEKPLTLEWDMSQTRNLDDLDPSKKDKPEIFAYDHDLMLKLRLSDDRVFEEQLQQLFCKHKGGRVYFLSAHTRKMTLEEANRKADELIRYWQFPRKNFDQWYERTKNKQHELDDQFETMRNDLEPSLSLAIRHSYSDEKPWRIDFEVYWDN